MKQNVLRRLGALVLTLALTLSLTVTPAWAAPPPLIENVILENLTISDNQSNQKIRGSVIFDNGDTDAITYLHSWFYWNSGNTDVADITGSGVLIPHKEGETIITAVVKGNTSITGVCTVTVTSSGGPALDPPGITLDPDGPMNAGKTGFLLTLEGANTAILNALVTNGSGMKVVWSTSNPAVATVRRQSDNDDTVAVVTAEGRGHAVIRASLRDDTDKEVDFAEFPVDVYDYVMELRNVTANDIRVSSLAFNLDKDKTCTLSAAVIGSDATVRDHIIWETTDESIVKMEEKNDANGNAVFKAMGPGTARITAKRTVNGVEVVGYCDIIVPTPGTVSVQSVTLNTKELTLGLNGTETLRATVSPYNARDKEVTWTSSNSIVASVDQNGKVTANSVGTATIRVTSKSDYTKYDECVVTVKPGLTGLSIKNTMGGRFELSSNMTKPGDTQMIEALPYPSNAYFTYESVTWTSDKPGVIQVEKDSREKTGLAAKLTFVGPGEAEITVKSGDVKGTCKITVPGVVLQSGVLTMTNGRLTMKEGQTETLTYQVYGRAASEIGTTAPVWLSSDSSIVDVDRNTGKLTARKPGTVTITLTLGNYEAKCTVTVAEDTSTLITVTERVSAGVPMSMYSARTSWGTIYSELNRIASEKLGGALSYINNISVPTEQGIVHNNHRSEADTGAGVGIMEQYKPSGTGPDTLSALSFVPRSTYSGTAEITFTGWGNGRSFNGTIRVTVAGLGDGGDVSYSTNGDPVTFLSDDFNIVSNSKAGHNLKYITFTPPAASVGTLYYNYTSESHPGEKVAAATQYRRSGTPSLDKVTFVPAKGYSGTVRINYRAVDSSDVAYTGTVTIRVAAQYDPAGPGDIYYSTGYGSWATFRAVDFANASLRATGEALSYVRFRQPPSSEGTLFYNYSGFASNGGVVSPETSYHSGGTPLLGSVSFVPTTTSPSQVEVPYTGYSIRGTAFTGTVHVTVVGKPVQPNESGTWYTTIVGRSLELKGSDFYRACQEATGKTLYYVQFTSLPSVGTGTLRYTSQSGANSSTVSTDTWCYYDRPNAGVMLDNVYFQPGSNFTGTVRIPYRGYCTDRTAFDGEVVIRVAAAASTAGSSYFNDMRNHSWAVSAVDYLYEKGVVNGVGNGGFGPGQRVLRRDFVVMLCRAFNFDSYSTYSFPDVPTNAYYSRPIAAAKELGVVSGSGGNFMPNGQLTRQDAMVMIKNALDAAGWRVGTASTSVLNRFPDRGSVAAYAQDAVSTLVQLGAVSGDGNGRLNPRSTITRAEVAVILHYIMTM